MNVKHSSFPLQVDRAKAMIELLMSPDDETMSEHKKLQLRELAALNGTLKDEVVGAGGVIQGRGSVRLAGEEQASASSTSQLL
jgi:hypothetical protein